MTSGKNGKILRGPARKAKKKQYGDPPMNELRACLSVSGVFLLAALFGAAPPVHAQGDASRATPPPGKALVFVFRSDRQPVAAQVPVLVNLVRIGDLTNGTFAVATVNPGRTFLRIGEQAVAVFTLEAAANRSYFVRVEAVSSVRPVRTEVRLVNEVDGRRSLAQSRRVGPAPRIAGAPRAQPPAAPVAAPPRAAPPPVAAAPRAQPSPPRPQATAPSAEPGGDWNFALIAKGGAFKLANANQTVAGTASTFDTTSKPAVGIEAEWRNKAGFAVSGEIFYYKNDLVATGVSAKQQVLALMANGKYYFHVADWFHPFVGAGVGYAESIYSGDLKGTAGGAAFQGLAGMEFRFERVGVLVQYKYLSSTTGKSGNDVKVGGGGVLAGVSIPF
jgi:opacity protein-like surface antigen